MDNFRLRLRFFSLNVEKINVKRSILFQISYFRKSVVKKTTCLYYSYDPKLLNEKNLIQKVDSVKKLINIWSSRGISIYGKVTIIKSLIIPKFVYIVSLLPTPKIVRIKPAVIYISMERCR